MGRSIAAPHLLNIVVSRAAQAAPELNPINSDSCVASRCVRDALIHDDARDAQPYDDGAAPRSPIQPTTTPEPPLSTPTSECISR
jgi:hypothetical protein